MNKFMKFLALVLVMGTLLAFAACTPNDTTTTTAPNGTTTKPDATTTAPNATTTAAPTTTVAPKPITYRIRVVDEEGNPVKGAMVQLCLGEETCFTPVRTDEDGWAGYTNPVRDGYCTKITMAPTDFEVPEGKKVDDSYHYFESGVTEITLVLKLVDDVA